MLSDDWSYEVTGTFENTPGSDIFAIANYAGRWWPQPHSLRATAEGQWTVKFHFGCAGKHTLYIVKANELGAALMNYYRKVTSLNEERTTRLKGNLKFEGAAAWLRFSIACTMIAAPVQCDVDGIPEGSHKLLPKRAN